jgi:ribosome-binding protein aMBF1 (putative translation factor)
MAKEISDKMANRLWKARRSTTLADSQLAKKIGISKTQIRRFYGENRRNFSDTNYQKLWRFAYYGD